MKIGRGLSRRCSNCAASEKQPRVQIGKDGLCEECREYISEFWTDYDTERYLVCRMLINEQLVEFREYMAKRGKVVLLFSGGKDSTYLLHWLREKHPNVEVICLMVDNGFLPEVAVETGVRVTKKLGADFILLRRGELFREVIRESFIEAVKKGEGCSQVVDFADGETIHEIGYQYCQKIGANAISAVSKKQLEQIFKTDYFMGSKAVTSPYDVDVLFPYAFLDLSEEYIKEKCVQLKLMSKRSADPLSTNSALITLMAVVDVCNLGYSSFEPEFCSMIREGKADYRTWCNVFSLIEHCAKTGFLVKDEVKDICTRLDLNPKTLNIGWL